MKLNGINQIKQRINEQYDATRGFQSTLRHLFRLFLPLIFSTIGLAWAFYPESYEFQNEYISDLGRLFSKDDSIRNLKSQITMNVGFSLIAALAFTITGLYLSRFFLLKEERKHGWFIFVKGFLTLLIAIGALGVAVPTDHSQLSLLHAIGTGLFIGSFGLLNLLMQLVHSYSKWQIRKEDLSDYTIDIVVSIIVLLALILFIIFYILNISAPDPAIESTTIKMQKIILIVDCIAIWRLDIDDM